jgi:membrane protease YdiL (CAAX protease family)
LISGEWSSVTQFGRVAEYPALDWYVGWALWILTFGLGEETGWRGYALPRLQRDRSARSATLIVGLLWAFWHLPAFFYNFELTVFGMVAFVVSILSGAVVLTWLFNSTRGSLIPAILWHGSFNAAVAGAEGFVAALVSAFIIAGAIWIGNYYGPERFSSQEKQTI